MFSKRSYTFEKAIDKLYENEIFSILKFIRTCCKSIKYAQNELLIELFFIWIVGLIKIYIVISFK